MPSIKIDSHKAPDLSMKPLKSIQELLNISLSSLQNQIEYIHGQIALGQSTHLLDSELDKRLKANIELLVKIKNTEPDVGLEDMADDTLKTMFLNVQNEMNKRGLK